MVRSLLRRDITNITLFADSQGDRCYLEAWFMSNHECSMLKT